MGLCCPSNQKEKKVEFTKENKQFQISTKNYDQNLQKYIDSKNQGNDTKQYLNITNDKTNNTIQNISALKDKNNETIQEKNNFENLNNNLFLNFHPPTDIKNSYNQKSINYNNIFPSNTNYEKELNSNFKYFNVFWYDPNKTNDFIPFIKCFENVQFYKDDDLTSTINFFKKESVYEWIVITPGSQGKDLISNLENYICINSFFIYCRNPSYHNWAKNIKKVGCITSNPKILCEKLIEINKKYIIPNFNYKAKTNNDTINYNKNDSENKISFKSSLLKQLIDNKNKIKNKYNIFCIKLLHYLNTNEIIKDINKSNTTDINPVLTMSFIKQKSVMELFPIMINIVKQYCLLSLYFNNYPYLLNIYSFSELKNLFNPEETSDTGSDEMSKTYSSSSDFSEYINIAGELYQKILNGECILDDKTKLKKVHNFLLKQISISFCFFKDNSIINYFQIFNFLRDIDFCLKVVIIGWISIVTNEKYNFLDELVISLMASEPRIPIYFSYLNYQMAKDVLSNGAINTESQDIINGSLTIRDFIVLGDKKFYEKIKPIEIYIKSKSFKYIRPEEISNYLKKSN